MSATRVSFPRAPIAVALDAPSLADLCTWAEETAPFVSCLKVGLEVFYRDGREAVAAARAGACSAGVTDSMLFLDVKLHDIPATVRGAAAALRDIAPDFLTVHASGGPDMIAAACAVLPDTRITAVTVLTSLGPRDLATLGLDGAPEEIVVRWAAMAVDAGARAIVCSPLEVAAVRAAVPDDVVLITPGVRPAGAGTDDQKRVTTPEEAIRMGADLLVIGRPITGAAKMADAARAIGLSLTEVGGTS
jgi:orotidine-5'-phosphate decarboxylase